MCPPPEAENEPACFFRTGEESNLEVFFACNWTQDCIEEGVFLSKVGVGCCGVPRFLEGLVGLVGVGRMREWSALLEGDPKSG